MMHHDAQPYMGVYLVRFATITARTSGSQREVKRSLDDNHSIFGPFDCRLFSYVMLCLTSKLQALVDLFCCPP